ncbi:MAG: alginate export family protein [Pseudomonadales bacterium]|nr:alginate export family protein [Gammaproteobacteria bacterium]NNL56785.1 alginate export family protein [Pseudomonadales bacterium]
MLNRINRSFLVASLGGALLCSAGAAADALTAAIVSGKASGDIRIRYEDVSSGSNDSDGITIRTRLGYTTASYEGFSATVEFEDVRDMFGIDDEKGFIPDNEVTELDQGFLQYKGDKFTAKLGRQVIAIDGHRHVGHVGWRQDRQTFDAARVTMMPLDKLTVDLSYIYRRNGINGSGLDIPNAAFQTVNLAYAMPAGKLVGYSYLISQEGGIDETDTYGVSFSGKTKGDIPFLYAVEYATQENVTKNVDTDYTFVELGVTVSGVTGKLGYEVLGSDTNGGVTENFSTPLATVHKFQGWADQFLGGSVTGTINGGNGVEDKYLSVTTKWSGIKWLAVYHDYDADQGSADLGDELNLLAAKKFAKNYSAGLKYADYNAGDSGTGTDTEKLWFWLGMKF